jgi:hypothetical protein
VPAFGESIEMDQEYDLAFERAGHILFFSMRALEWRGWTLVFPEAS